MVLSLTILDPKIPMLWWCSSRWHRVAYSVKAKSVTLYLDCQKIESRRLQRADDAVVSTDGVTMFGTRLLDKAVFEVRCQPGLRGFDYENQAWTFVLGFFHCVESKVEMGWLTPRNCLTCLQTLTAALTECSFIYLSWIVESASSYYQVWRLHSLMYGRNVLCVIYCSTDS